MVNSDVYNNMQAKRVGKKLVPLIFVQLSRSRTVFPHFSLTTLEFPDFSRFFRWVVTVLLYTVPKRPKAYESELRLSSHHLNHFT